MGRDGSDDGLGVVNIGVDVELVHVVQVVVWRLVVGDVFQDDGGVADDAMDDRAEPVVGVVGKVGDVGVRQVDGGLGGVVWVCGYRLVVDLRGRGSR